MNIPNFLTISRIFFVPLLVAALVEQNIQFTFGSIVVTNEWLALGIFLCAAATDLLDGYLARRLGQITTIGTLLDPIADKLLISAALIALVQVRAVPGWLVILLISREFAVTGLRGIAAAEGYVIRSSDLGKTKTTAQVLGIGVLLMSMNHPWLVPAAHWSMGAVVAFSLISAVDYFWKFWRVIDSGTKKRRRREIIVAERQARLAAFRENKANSVREKVQGKAAGLGGARGTT